MHILDLTPGPSRGGGGNVCKKKRSGVKAKCCNSKRPAESIDTESETASRGPRQKGRDLTQSYDKSPYTNRKRKGRDLTQPYDRSPYTDGKNLKSNVTTQRTPPKTSITQRLRTDLGRSAGVTIATQLVWLNRFTGSQPSH